MVTVSNRFILYVVCACASQYAIIDHPDRWSLYPWIALYHMLKYLQKCFRLIKGFFRLLFQSLNKQTKKN